MPSVPPRRPRRTNLQGVLLVLLALPLLPRTALLLWQGRAGAAFVGGLVFVLLLLAALLTRRGVDRARRCRERGLTCHPVPFRSWGLFVTVLAALLISLGLDHDGFWRAMTLGGLAGLGYWLDYGLDPGAP